MKKLLVKLGLKKAKPTSRDAVGAFLREASSRQQKKVFRDAARIAMEDQRKILNS